MGDGCLVIRNLFFIQAPNVQKNNKNGVSGDGCRVAHKKICFVSVNLIELINVSVVLYVCKLAEQVSGPGLQKTSGI